MSSDYVKAALAEATYEHMENDEFFVASPSLPGAWATGATVEDARTELAEVVGDFVTVSRRFGNEPPEFGGYSPARSA